MKDVKGFAEFEEQERLFDREYAGIPYWQYLRFFVFHSATSDYIEKGIDVSNRITLHQKLKDLVHRGVKGIRSELALKRCAPVDIILFRVFEESDRFYDYWKLPEEIKAIRIMQSMGVEKESSPEVFYMEFCKVMSAVIYHIRKKLHRGVYDEKEFQFLKELERKVISRFGRCMTAEQMHEQVQGYCHSKKTLQKYFGRLFDRLKPRAIVVVCYYNATFYAAYEEAKKRGIRIIELQHGVINNHQEYWFEDQRGINNLTPDYMLLFGRIHETWTKLLKNTVCVPVGFPFQEYELKRLGSCEADEKTVVIYPQSDERFETVISEFIDKAGPLGYKMIMKVHPGQSNDLEIYFPLLSKKKNLEIITDQSKGIYYWLKRGKHHVIANSTVGFEAAAVEGSNICIALNVDHAMTQPLLDWGVARGFQTADELLKLICNPKKVDLSHKRELWEENASDNMERFFLRMAKQGWPDGTNFRESAP